MENRSISPADIEMAIQRKSWNTRFAPVMEKAFIDFTRNYHVGFLRTAIIPSLIIYNLFLFADFLLPPSTFNLSVFLHAGVSIWILIVGGLLKRFSGFVSQQLLAVSIPIVMVMQILTIYVVSHGENAEHYQYLAIPIIVYMNVFLRPEKRFARAASIFITFIYAVAAFVSEASHVVTMFSMYGMIAVAYLTLSANARMERDTRHAFLRHLQDSHSKSQFQEAANKDALTGLSNRRHLDFWIEVNWPGLARDNISVAVIMIDVDHFKAFNDRHGHKCGDRCLEHVAGIIRGNLRQGNDLAVRYGGEEFLVLIAEADVTTARSYAERVRKALETSRLTVGGDDVSITASFGIIAGSARSHSIDELIEAADSGLYAAKLAGRNRIGPTPPNDAKQASGAMRADQASA